MFSLTKSKPQEAPSAQVSVPTPSFTEKMAEMALYGRLYMFCNQKTKYNKARITMHLDVETPGIGELEIKTEPVYYEGELPLAEVVTNLYEKFVMVKKLQF